MEKYKEKYRINSNRMPGWDYAKGGKYYITICTCNRICCFGDVINGEMHLSAMGKIARQLWLEIPEHFADTWLDEFIVMPNHIHGIIVMKRLNLQETGNGTNYRNNRNNGDDRNDGGDRNDWDDRNVETLHATSLHSETYSKTHAGNNKKTQQKIQRMSQISPKPGSLNTIIRSYKSACTKKFNEMDMNWYEWQPRFYDEIIRNDTRLEQIRAYIRNNPSNWDADENNPEKLKP